MAKVTKLDELIADYNTLFESATPVGNVLVYERYTWNAIRGQFANIVAEFPQDCNLPNVDQNS